MKKVILVLLIIVVGAVGMLLVGEKEGKDVVKVGPYNYHHSVGNYSFSVPAGYLALDNEFITTVNNSDSIEENRKEMFLKLIDQDLLGDSDVWLGGKSGQNSYIDIVITVSDYNEIPGGDLNSFYDLAKEKGLKLNKNPDTESIVYDISNEGLDKALAVNTTFFEPSSEGGGVKEYRYNRFLMKGNRYVIVSGGVVAGLDIDINLFDEETLIRDMDTIVRTFEFD